MKVWPFLLVAALAAFGCGGCTINYYRNVPAPPPAASPTSTTHPSAASCEMDWRGFAPAGWTLATVNESFDRLPAGCGKPGLLVHPAGQPVDWTSSQPSSDQAVIRGAVTQTVGIGDSRKQLIHLFTGSAGPAITAPPVILLTGLRGERGEKGDPGKDGRDGRNGVDGAAGLPGPAGPAATADRGGPDTREKAETSEFAAAIPPALAGGGLVYGLMYLNLLGAPGGQRLRRARRGGHEADEGERTVAAAAAGDPRDDPRVRIRSSRLG